MFSAVLTAGLCWSLEVKLCGASLPRALCGPAAGGSYSPVALAMISLATLVGTSA